VNSHLLLPGAERRGGGCPWRPATPERRSGGATPSRRPGAKGSVVPVARAVSPLAGATWGCSCRGRERSKAVPIGLVWAG
jgi:hypothetical protein